MPIIASYPQSFISISYTATADAMFHLIEADLWFRDVNIHITTNNAKYGDRSAQEAEITSGDIVCFEDVNLADIFFKNAGAGSNTVIRAVGVVMTPGRKKELEIMEPGR